MENKKKSISIYEFAFIIVTLMAMLFFSFCATFFSNNKSNNPKVFTPEFSGSYMVNNSNDIYKIPDNKKILFINKDINSITLLIQFDKMIKQDSKINMFMDNVNLYIYKNNSLFGKYISQNSCPDIVHSGGKEWIYFKFPHINKEDVIKIEITSTDNNLNSEYITRFLQNIFIGEDYDFLKYQLQKNLLNIIIAVIIFITGFVLIVAMLTLKIMRVPILKGDLSCGLLMISGAISIFINYDYITLLVNNTFLINLFDFVNHIFLLYFMLIYFKLYHHGRTVKKVENYFVLLWSIIIIAFFIFQTTNLIDYINYSKYIVLPSIIIISITILFLFVDLNKIENTMGKIIIISGITICMSMIIELINKLITGYFFMYTFEFSLVFFSIIQFVSIMVFAKRNLIQASKADEMESELLQSKISVMLSQIQPHFLYNTLVVIRQLCDINPKQAKEAVTEFANYLRGNLDSLTLNTTISFEKEMEHVENYISLEKKRFGDKINIEYNIEATEFEVPSLTIQTVVENAVRHGITKRKDGGTVTISTKEYISEYLIEIRDNGIGFDTTIPHNENDKRSHIGVENSAKRIETMCGGNLKFSSTPGVGTTVLITIPK